MARLLLPVIAVGRAALEPSIPAVILAADGAAWVSQPGDMLRLTNSTEAAVNVRVPATYPPDEPYARAFTMLPGSVWYVRVESANWTQPDGTVHVDTDSDGVSGLVLTPGHFDLSAG